MRYTLTVAKSLASITVGIVALLLWIGVLDSSAALAQHSPGAAEEVSQSRVKKRDVSAAMDPQPRIQAAVPLTDPDLDIWIDCDLCPDPVDTDGDGAADALWSASGQGRARRDRGTFRGQGFLNMGDASIAISFKKVDRVLRDENGEPLGVALSGRAQLNDGEGTTKTRIAVVALPVPGSPERLNWDVRGPGVTLQFEAHGQLAFAER